MPDIRGDWPSIAGGDHPEYSSIETHSDEIFSE